MFQFISTREKLLGIKYLYVQVKYAMDSKSFQSNDNFALSLKWKVSENKNLFHKHNTQCIL